MIITSCPNCIMQFKFTMKDKKIFHYLEIINKILTERGEKNGGKI
jgi:glycolate oxidase iron-sulfur subunit